MSTTARNRDRRTYGLAPFPGPGAGVADRDEDQWWLDREVGILQRALEDRGEMRRGELGDLVGCKYRGTGRFSAALRAAVDRGVIRRTGLGRYAPASGAG
jgi:hypothetical protein